MNVELLHKIKKHVLAEPKRLNMGSYIIRKEEDKDFRYPKCGTIGCIAGWAVTLSTKEKVSYGKIRERAERLLGLNEYQASLLFYDFNWPSRLYLRLGRTNPQTVAHAKITAKRIDHFIATNGKE